MANWLMVIDEDEARRGAYAARVQSLVAPIAGLRIERRDGAGWSAVWAAASSAPIDVQVGSQGGAIVWGEARDAAGALQTAAAVRTAWRAGKEAQWDGFYAAAVMEEGENTLTVGTDLLGIFPVYYWSDANGVVLVGTSPELFRTHPRFRPELNVTGLVGILLTNGLVDGETLWRGVRRLAPGRRLRFAAGRLWEDESYRIPAGMLAVDLPLAGHVELLADAVSAAVKRHAPPGRSYGLLLSGGLDSRMLAGFLAEQDAKVSALIFGRSRDIEMKCASAVAQNLRFAHHSAEVPAAAYAPAAEKLATWEALAAGFGGVQEWAMHDSIATLADRVVTGHAMDAVIGGIHIGWAYDAHTRKMGFDELLPTVIAWGFQPAVLKSLLIPACREAVDDAMARLRAEYDGGAESEPHRAWLFDLRHRMRFHVGSAIWAASFASWPVLPFVDRNVMDVSAGIPASSLADRRAQTELLMTRFPELAALPLDRNSHDMRPLRPGVRDEVMHYVNQRRRNAASAVRRVLGRGEPEDIYYRREYDLNSPGWQAVRALAEPHRRDIPAVLLKEAVDEWLPPPGAHISVKNPVKETSGAKMLLGLALWNRQPQAT